MWFAGEMKKTLSIKGRKDAYNIDQEVRVAALDWPSAAACLSAGSRRRVAEDQNWCANAGQTVEAGTASQLSQTHFNLI